MNMAIVSSYPNDKIFKRIVRDLQIHPAYFRIHKRHEGQGFDFFVVNRYAEIVKKTLEEIEFPVDRTCCSCRHYTVWTEQGTEYSDCQLGLMDMDEEITLSAQASNCENYSVASDDFWDDEDVQCKLFEMRNEIKE